MQRYTVDVCDCMQTWISWQRNFLCTQRYILSQGHTYCTYTQSHATVTLSAIQYRDTHTHKFSFFLSDGIPDASSQTGHSTSFAGQLWYTRAHENHIFYTHAHTQTHKHITQASSVFWHSKYVIYSLLLAMVISTVRAGDTKTNIGIYFPVGHRCKDKQNLQAQAQMGMTGIFIFYFFANLVTTGAVTNQATIPCLYPTVKLGKIQLSLDSVVGQFNN